jgi:hypothetical protein
LLLLFYFTVLLFLVREKVTQNKTKSCLTFKNAIFLFKRRNKTKQNKPKIAFLFRRRNKTNQKSHFCLEDVVLTSVPKGNAASSSFVVEIIRSEKPNQLKKQILSQKVIYLYFIYNTQNLNVIATSSVTRVSYHLNIRSCFFLS